jgi:hypothetical protein
MALQVLAGVRQTIVFLHGSKKLDNSTMLKIGGCVLLAMMVLAGVSRRFRNFERAALPAYQRERRHRLQGNWQRRNRPGLRRAHSENLLSSQS